MQNKKIFQFIVAVIVCEGAGFVGSIFTTPAIPIWYPSLAKPSFSPPNWIFAPVWTTLFFLMAIALYLMWQKREVGKVAKLAIILFFSQLALNILWSVLFFGLKSPILASVEIIILWLFILATMITFYRLDKRAGSLFLPYLLWVSFASILNFAIWQLNG